MTTAFPLAWPDGWPRTKARENDHRFGARLTTARAAEQLYDELRILGARQTVISSNVPLRRDGIMQGDNRRLDDPGVAVYFHLKGRPMVMARDAYVSVAGNLRSLALAIEAMRQLARHGGDQMMERAFTGFVPIAPPDWKKPWRQVFGVTPDWRGDIRALYREKAQHRHPDRGGDDMLMAELNVAYKEAQRELGG